MFARYQSKKFALAVAALLVSAAGLFAGKLDGGTWVASCTLILGLYAAADVTEKKNSKL